MRREGELERDGDVEQGSVFGMVEKRNEGRVKNMEWSRTGVGCGREER